jgi:hypothetical protein
MFHEIGVSVLLQSEALCATCIAPFPVLTQAKITVFCAEDAPAVANAKPAAVTMASTPPPSPAVEIPAINILFIALQSPFSTADRQS